MMKLLKANLARLFANGIFRIAVVGSAFMGVFCAVYGHRLLVVVAAPENAYSLDHYFFTFSNVIAFGVAAFCSFFISSEYGAGTLRNKITAGCTRAEIYLSNLLSNLVAGCVLYTAYLIMSFCTGRPLIGKFSFFTKYQIFIWVISIYMVMAAVSAISTCIAMLVSSKVISISMSVIAVVAGFCAGIFLLDKLTDVYLWMEGMEKTREIVLFLADFLPGSQLMEFFALDRRIGNLNPCIIVSGAVFFIALTTVIGLLRFRKKELQ